MYIFDQSLLDRLNAIKYAYEKGIISSVPYIEPRRDDDDFGRFSQIIEVKKEEDSGSQQGSGGGGTLQGLRQKTTRRPAGR